MNDATPTITTSNPNDHPPAGTTLPLNLEIAEWTDCGEYGFDSEPDYVRTVGDAGEAIWMRIDALFGFFGFGQLLFATSDDRLCAAGFDLYCRLTGGAETTGEETAADPSFPDNLGIADWISFDLIDPNRAGTVGELKREVWRQIVARINAGYVGPLTFVAKDGQRYEMGFEVGVRLADSEAAREVIEEEKEFERESAADRIEELDRYLKRLGG